MSQPGTNPEVLIQAKYLFRKIGIPTKKIRRDLSGGYTRYKIGIATKDNIEKFKEKIDFVPNTDKYDKLIEILNGYKEYHKMNNSSTIFEIVKNNPHILTKDIIRKGNLDRSVVSRNLKKLRFIGKMDYIKGRGNERFWHNIEY